MSKNIENPVLPEPEAKANTPRGEVELLIVMHRQWQRIPNTLIEDETGQLWLAYGNYWSEEINTDRGYQSVDVIQALTWLHDVSDWCDGWCGDVADVCRIALTELKRKAA